MNRSVFGDWIDEDSVLTDEEVEGKYADDFEDMMEGYADYGHSKDDE